MAKASPSPRSSTFSPSLSAASSLAVRSGRRCWRRFRRWANTTTRAGSRAEARLPPALRKLRRSASESEMGHCRARDDRAGMTDHRRCEAMSGESGGFHGAAREAEGEIAGVEGISRRRRIDRHDALGNRHMAALAGTVGKASLRAELHRHLGNSVGGAARDRRRGIGVAEKPLLVLEGREGDIDPSEKALDHPSRRRRIGPAGGPVVAIESDAVARLPRSTQRREEAVARRIAEDREGYRREIDEVIAGQRGEKRCRRGVAKELARRRRRAVVEEAPLAAPVEANEVEAWELARKPRH